MSECSLKSRLFESGKWDQLSKGTSLGKSSASYPAAIALVGRLCLLKVPTQSKLGKLAKGLRLILAYHAALAGSEPGEISGFD